MITGKVKWWNKVKKYGFIIVEGRDIFCHFTAIQKEGYKSLDQGDKVELEIVPGLKGGDIAANVRTLEKARAQGK